MTDLTADDIAAIWHTEVPEYPLSLDETDVLVDGYLAAVARNTTLETEITLLRADRHNLDAVVQRYFVIAPDNAVYLRGGSCLYPSDDYSPISTTIRSALTARETQ